MTISGGEGPLVSVIVPAWNAARTIGDTLRSVAGQTYRNIEIIIVDDGSTDSTAEQAQRFCDSEPRARLLRKDNWGVASARNHGAAQAGGEWIAPIDADDLWHPTRIEKMLAAALGARARPGFVCCWHRAIDEQAMVLSSGPRWTYSGRAFRQLAFVNVVGCGSGLLIAADALRAAGGYDESLRARNAQGCEDMMIQLRIARDHPIEVVPEHLVGWRQHQANMSGDFDQIERSCRLVFQTLRDEGSPIPDKVLRWIDARWSFDIAQNRAVAGQAFPSARHVMNAVRRDPVGSGAMLAYRLLRSVLRRGRPKPAPGPVSFYDVDPAAEIRSDAYELRWFSTLVRSLEGARLKSLAAVDAQSAA